MKKILPYPHMYQKAVWDCGLAATAGILAYDGLDYTYDALGPELDFQEGAGVLIYDIARYFRKRNYQVTLQTFNARLFTRSHYVMSQGQLRSHVADITNTWGSNGRWARHLEKLASFMDEGGDVLVKIPTAKDLQDEIARDRPVIASVTTRFMQLDDPFYNMHFAAVTGYDDNGFFVHDPSPDVNYPSPDNTPSGIYYSNEEMLFAVHANMPGEIDNCSILKLTPP